MAFLGGMTDAMGTGPLRMAAPGDTATVESVQPSALR